LIILLALYIISGGFMKQTYLEPWDKKYSTQFSDPRIRLTAVGLLAANNHNMQPWKIKLDKENPMVFYLYADSSCVTNEVDPLYRQMMITQGTFLEYVRVAGKKQGWNTEIKLFPDGNYKESDILNSMDTKPVAKITLSKTNQTDSKLYDAMYMADTNRGAYQQEQLTSSQITALESLSSEKNVTIKLFTKKDDLNKIGTYALKSATVEAGVARVMDESNVIFRANEYQKNKYRYGYSVEGQGATGFKKNILQGLLTLVPSLNTGKGATKNFISYTKISVENTPAYAMIITDGNSRVEQVESGMLYSRLVLTGHTQGLVMQPLSQVLEEYPEMKDLYNEFKQIYAPENGTVQMLFRVGKPTIDAPVTMRRDVYSLIIEK
jgi:hypothetical protein